MLRKKVAACFIAFCTVFSIVPAQNTLAANSVDTSKKIHKFVTAAVKVARDDRYGYSQGNRWGDSYDCSSLVIRSLRKAGISTGSAYCTYNMKSGLRKKGFIFIPGRKLHMSGSSRLKKGDILLRSGHTEVYAGNNMRVGAHRNYDGRRGDSSGREISVKKYYNCNWSGVLRYVGTGKKITASKYKTGKYILTCRRTLYNAPKKTAKPYFKLPVKTKIRVIKVKDGYGKIKINGKTGWIVLNRAKKVH